MVSHVTALPRQVCGRTCGQKTDGKKKKKKKKKKPAAERGLKTIPAFCPEGHLKT